MAIAFCFGSDGSYARYSDGEIVIIEPRKPKKIIYEEDIHEVKE